MKTITQINTKIPEGRLLLAALAMITTESRLGQTPDEVLQAVSELEYKMHLETVVTEDDHATAKEEVEVFQGMGYVEVPLFKEWPESSNVEKTEFDKTNRVLIVTFKNNKKYAYQDFIEKDWKKLLSAQSIGKHINSEVKGVHLSVEITPKPTISDL